MCGIVGVIPNFKSNGFQLVHQKMFYQMLFADLLRGNDATGVITCHSNGDFGIMKEASDAYQFNWSFIDSDLDKDLYKNGVAVIGHNRAKTIGANKDECAHPFVVDKTFAMVHNGTLHNHKAMEDTEVDSEALAITFKKAMDEEDWKTAMEDALGKVSGAFACVWYDQKRHELCMIRNSQRPLGIVQTGNATLFGSELNLLTWIASRNTEKVEKVEMLKEHVLYRFDLKKTGGVPDETFLSLKKPTALTGKGFTNGVVHGTGTTGVMGTTSPTLLSKDEKERGVIDAVIKSLVTPSTPQGRAEISKSAFKRLRSKLMFKRINFWLDDYVEKNIGSTGATTDVMLMGSSVDGAFDLCEIHHFIRGEANIQLLGLKEEELMKSILFNGQIYDMEYDRDMKAVIIKVQHIEVKEVRHDH